MSVEGAHAHNCVRRQPQALCPFSGEPADTHVRGVRLRVQARAQAAQERVDLDQECLGWKAFPFGVPHGLVPGRAAAALHGERVGGAGEKGRHPVAVLHPGEGGAAHLAVFPQHVEDLRPVPFRRIHPALVPGEIVPPQPRATLLISSASFTAVWSFHSTNMALGFSSNPFVRARGSPRAVHGAGGGSGGVDADGGNVLARALSRLCQDAFYRGLHALDVVQRVLAEAVLRRVTVFPCRPALVVGDRVSQLLAAQRVDEHRAHRVGAEVHSDDQRVFRHALLLPSVRRGRGRGCRRPIPGTA